MAAHLVVAQPAAALKGSTAAGDREYFTIERAAEVAQSLERWLKGQWTIVSGESGRILYNEMAPSQCDWAVRAELCREVARRRRPEFIAEDDPLVVLALPLAHAGDDCLVAVCTFVTRPIVADDATMVSRAARLLGLPATAASEWLGQQGPLSAEAILRIAELAAEKIADEEQIEHLEQEVENLSVNLGSTYEEISLIYRLTQNLKLSSRFEEMGQLSLGWLADVLPAEGLAMHLMVDLDSDPLAPVEQRSSTLLTHGDCPVDAAQFIALAGRLALANARQAVVVNRPFTSKPDWEFPKIHEMVVIPLVEGERQFGWLAAFNHSHGGEFGTVEASLLNSVGMILGIHSGNVQLYRQQADMLAGVVRAMTSAIDAKDPYTRGHSDRVARIAVRLADELGCDPEMKKTVYLSGMLHDIGKIGIDDHVLRKPGKLTEAEFEHIKTHVAIGHRILRDLRKMGHVLPVVLHHHESWDGKGYPAGLSGEGIPYLARIVAVADAYDAMVSDRPYRKGMDDAKLDEVIRGGAGRQWDPKIVQAFFSARADIRMISQHESTCDDLDAMHWS
jgi:hypothetical protein